MAELERMDAANLGGIMVATGRPGFQAAVARAYNSSLGLGGASYHAGHAEPGPAESAYLGIMRASAVRGIGGFDESLRRGEDWEMNFRLRKAGHLVWLDPGLRVTYWPRDTWNKLARQFLSTGIWRGELTRRLGAKNPLRFFAPPLLVANLVVAMIVAVLQLTGCWAGRSAGSRRWCTSVRWPTPESSSARRSPPRGRCSTGSATSSCWPRCTSAGARASSSAPIRGGGDSVDTSRVDS